MLKKSTIWLLLSLFLIGAMIPAILLHLSDSSGPKEPFFRMFADWRTAPITVINRSNDIYRFAGNVGDKLYFAGDHPGHYLVSNYNLSETKVDSLRGEWFPKTHVPYQMFVDSGKIYICDGNFKSIIVADRMTGQVTNSLRTHYVFTRASVLSPTAFALRAFDTVSPPDQIFLVYNTANHSTIREKGISAKNGDAGISTDGVLAYDISSRQVIFCPFYSSKILKLDTRLNPVESFNTIDKSGFSGTKGGNAYSTNASEQKYTNLTPRYYINRLSCLYGGYLFVVSNAIAANQSQTEFNSNATVDIYDLANDTYILSFYLPNIGGERVSELAVCKNAFVALYKSHVAAFAIPKSLIGSLHSTRL